MKKIALFLFAVFCLGTLATAEDRDGTRLKARLTGDEGVPTISTDGTGTFEATISPDNTTITFTLTWKNLSTPAFMAHIHFGARKTAGDIVVFLCGDAPDGSDKPDCQNDATNSGTASGTLTAANVLDFGDGPDQNINPGEFNKLVRAIRQGFAYVNVHSNHVQGGEVRGQIEVVRGDRD
jgi:hypothetical protein